MESPDSSKLGLTDVSPLALLSGAVAMAAISATPYLNIVNLFLGLGIALGGALAVWGIFRLDNLDFNPSLGFKFGAWSGLFGAALTVIIINGVALFLHYDVTEPQTQFVTSLFTQKTSSKTPDGVGIGPYYIANAQGEVIAADEFPTQNLDRNILVDFAISIPLYALFGGIGGAVVAALRKRKRR